MCSDVYNVLICMYQWHKNICNVFILRCYILYVMYLYYVVIVYETWDMIYQICSMFYLRYDM